MIDEYSVITNGILTSDDSVYKILDPLGYFVIKVEVIIEPIPDVLFPGGGFVSPTEEVVKYRKRIRLSVFNYELGIEFIREIEQIDVTHTIKDVKLVDGNIVVEIYNPQLNEVYSRKITLDIQL
jgi:hypothetical protein